MDKNKLKKLKKVGYVARKTCALCKHFVVGRGVFGTCSLHRYDHLKHTDSMRQLSVGEHGYCNQWELSDLGRSKLHDFIELLEE